MSGLNQYLCLAAILFGIGVFGVFAKRNAIA
ncbi:MAG: NADH-quinone oxidoreductase subunit K, partial [Syntrophomonadaceae bacterium]|nr:NADH-quinone oxidoreductase subunit K [Syntrophomonadaceae bacterium]